MKNLIYLSLLAAPIFAAGNAKASELSIGMADNSKFLLAFDNTSYTTPSNTYNVTNVIPGMHHVRLTSAMNHMNGAYGMPRLLYDGWVNIPANAHVTAYALNLNQLNISSITPINQYGQGYYDPNNPYGNGTGYGYDPNNPYGNNGYGNNGYGNNGGNCGNGNNGYGNNGYGNNGYGNGNNGWNNYPPVIYPMSANDFNALKNSIRAQSFDSSRLTVAEQAVGMNHLSSQQVLELMKEFSFESTKLDFAKFAYGRTTDRNNYYLVNNGFTFSSSIDELAGYINNYHV